MKNENNQMNAGARQSNDPSRNDPTKKDERDNDATRIRPEKERKEEPVTPPATPSPGNVGVEEPATQAPENTPLNNPDTSRDQGANKGNGSQAFG